MNIRIIIPLFLLFAGFSLQANNTLNLNGTWRFALAKTEQEAASLENFYQSDFSADKFEPTPVPSNWAVLGYEEPVYRGFKDHKASEGFYLHDFDAPADMKGKRVLLHFGGVWASAEVWLNGTLLGRHNSGFTSFSFEVTGKLKTGASNRLAVRVRQVTRDYKFDTFDDWTLGGIYRDVYLKAMPEKRWIDHVVVKTEFDQLFQDADLKIRAMISDRQKPTLPGNYPSPGKPYDLQFTLSAKDGEEVAKRQLTIPAHIATDREINLTFRVKSPNHWTAETPYLYNLKVELLEDGNVAHTRTERVGFRRISTEGGVFRINGQAVKLRGVNRHDEHPDVGRATTREHWLQDITLMKEANINYIRMAHYTHAKGFIELCDEMGMYVGNEVSLGGAGDLMYDPSFSGAVLERTYETVMRDINSPSIIYWSVGNEDPLTSLHIASVKLTKALDPTRPILLPWRAEEWLPEEVDILAPHYWTPQEYDQLAAHSNRPIITTEYTHAYGFTGLGTLEGRWKALTKHPSGAGAAVWMWADQGLKTPHKKTKKDRAHDDDYLRMEGEAWDGIVDSYRNLTDDYFETKAVYAQAYPSVNKLAFTPGQTSARVPILNDFDFTNLNQIKITWSIYEDEKELASGNGVIDGQPHAESAYILPMKKLKTVRYGKTYYAWFIFTNAEGKEINRKAVELLPKNETQPPLIQKEKLSVTKGENLTVTVGNTSYAFNPKTGQLVSAVNKNKSLITDIRPIIYRKPDLCEVTISGGRQVRDGADLNNYTPSVKSWNLKEADDKVIINANVEYKIDDKNRFTTAYRYTIATNGQLNIYYEILPEVQIPWLPIVGMTVQSALELDQIKWLGLGPYDAYPNRQAAAILGVWGGKAGGKETVGNKATRWIERSGSNGKFRIYNNSYMEHNASAPEILHILSDVLGRPEKGRKADESFPQLETKTGKPFVGEFSIEIEL